MMINSTMTVGEVATQLPGAARLFETLKIDYCCGGNRPLTVACAAIGIEVNEVIDMLQAVSRTSASNRVQDFQKLSLSELIDHILETHHVFTRQEMARLNPLTQKVISAHGENHPELHEVGTLLEVLCAELEPHMFKEEHVLFPYILELERAGLENRPAPFAPFGTVNNPVRMMMREHDTAGDILRKLRTVTADYSTPTDACISYRTLYEALEGFEKDLHQHIHLENNLLFPGAIEAEAKLSA